MQALMNSQRYPTDLVYHNIAIAAPYLDLVEEMTALEFPGISFRIKKLTLGPWKHIIGKACQRAANKQIRYFSSGMNND